MIAVHAGAHRENICQPNRDLGHVTVGARVVDIVGTVEPTKDVEISVPLPSVPTPTAEPILAIWYPKEESWHIYGFDLLPSHWAMEAVICVRHQYTGKRSATNELAGVLGTVQKRINIHLVDSLDGNRRVLR